jgi:hypothetical protein
MKTIWWKIGTYSQDDKKRMKKMGRKIKAKEMVKRFLLLLGYIYLHCSKIFFNGPTFHLPQNFPPFLSFSFPHAFILSSLGSKKSLKYRAV